MGNKESLNKIPRVGDLPFDLSVQLVEDRNRLAKILGVLPEALNYKDGFWYDENGQKVHDPSFDGIPRDGDAQYRYGHH